jgi:hypothetical protein
VDVFLLIVRCRWVSVLGSDLIAGGETSEVLETSEVWRVGLAWGLCFFVRLDGAGGNGVIAIAGDELETA